MAEPEAAVAIVRTRGAHESFLLIRRSQREDDPWSGHWSFPGGRRDLGDRDLLHTALRELGEECGIHLGREHQEAALPPVVARRRKGPFVLVAPFVFAVEGELPTVLDPREAVEALWISRSRCVDPAQHRLRPIPGRPPEMHYPAIDLHAIPLWGFTYRLITSWLGLCPTDSGAKQAGFEAACLVLDFLLSLGMKLEEGWRMALPAADGRHVARVAAVEGVIPVAQVRAHFSEPGSHVPRINLLEIRPEYIRVAGLAYEEYLITAVQ